MPTALILGATSDIGFSIAKKFASNKYDIQLAGRNLEQLKILQTDLQIRHSVEVSVYKFDVLDFSSHELFYNTLEKKPDVSIYVIGYMNDNEKVLKDQNEVIKTINTNYTGAVSILNIISADYAERRSGIIVGISSVAGNRGRQSNYIYGSSKAAFSAYLSGLRNRMYAYNVHVLTVLPGFVYTKMTKDMPLPAMLTATPELVAESVYNAVSRKQNIVYVKWFWKWIMMIITSIPESIFKKKKL